MKKICMFLAAALLMVMTGCGGGGDSSSAPSSAKAITAFSLNGIDGTINEAGKTITVTMPPDTTDVTALVATFTTTGASVKVLSIVQISGTTPNDFTGPNPVIYTVTAADATKQDYTVTVTVSSSFSGFLDKGFGTSGKVTTPVGSSDDYATALAIQSDGKIVAAGYYSYNDSKYDFALVRYNSDGSLDDGTPADLNPADKFGTGGKVTTSVGSGGYAAAYAIGIQSDGKIVVAGYSYNGSNNDFALVRYNTDGSLDDGTPADLNPADKFGTGGKVTTSVGSGNDYAHALVIQSDGKIVVAGFSYNGSKYDFALVRYNTDGSLDDGTPADLNPADKFGTGGKVTTSVGSGGYAAAYAIGIQSDDKIVVAGYSNNGTNNDFALVRYNADGSLDDGTPADLNPADKFGTGGKVTTSIGSGYDVAAALAIQPNGKIVVAGYSNNGGNNEFALVRYNTDGSLDDGTPADLNPADKFGTGGKVTTPIGIRFASATALGIQSDDKIVAAGISYDASNSDFVLVRYNAEGSLDTGFYIGGIVTTSIGSGLDVAASLGIQSDDKIVVAGYSYNGSTKNYDFALVRYWP